MTKGATPAYAVVRVDNFLGDAPVARKVTVKHIVWSLEEAQSEVERLNLVNAERGCEYFWQTTRVMPRSNGNQ